MKCFSQLNFSTYIYRSHLSLLSTVLSQFHMMNSSASQSHDIVNCRKGCGVSLTWHNRTKHEEIECICIPKDKRQRLMQMLTEETRKEQNQMLLKIKEKENEIESVKEELGARHRMLHCSTDEETHSYNESPGLEEQLQAAVAPVSMKVISFSDMKDKKQTFMSKPFYTHKNGYKMCLFIYPNGYGEAEGTHVSVMISIMRGDNDCKLQWPFCGVVTFQLLDQSKMRDHKEVTVSYLNSHPSYSSRVRIGNYTAAKGKFWMISHESLKENSGRQYVKDDSMIFYVCKVEINNSRAVKRTELRNDILSFLVFVIVSILVHLCFITYTYSSSS